MTAIEFDHIGKQYRLGLVSTGTLSHDLNRWWQTAILRREDPYLKIGSVNDRTKAADSDYVWALRDIDFKVEQGDVVGIIGKNGAGKSTLLKLLSKVTAPTVGTIRARGRIASLLEVGTGFHGEMTGRENIFLNGAIMGMTRQEISRKLDEIVDFSGCERYLDTPVKRYSSGMTVRLGFAVAAHLDPEIIVVDEVLAVGDAEFQKKAIGKMQSISHTQGRTVLFVSHNMGAVRNLCTRGIVLDKGLLVFDGETNAAVDFYTTACHKNDSSNFVELLDTHHVLGHTREVSFVSFYQPKESMRYALDEDIVFHIKLHASQTKRDCRINCTIWNMEGNPVGSVVSSLGFDIEKDCDRIIEYKIINPGLVSGLYDLTFSVGIGDVVDGLRLFDGIRNFMGFEIDKLSSVSQEDFSVWKRTWGSIMLSHQIRVIE